MREKRERERKKREKIEKKDVSKIILAKCSQEIPNMSPRYTKDILAEMLKTLDILAEIIKI